MTEQPSLAAQIDAVQWAELHAQEMGKRAHLSQAEIDEIRRRLQAAIETLKMLEFGREAL